MVAPKTEVSLSIIKDIMENMPDYSRLDNTQQVQVFDSALVAVAAYDFGLSSQHPLKSRSEEGCAKALELAPTLIKN
jgi:hypothetical protein